MAPGGKSEDDGAGGRSLDDSVRGLLAAGDVPGALNEALRVLGPDVLGFLYGVLRDEADAEEVFAMVSERLWRSLEKFQWRCALRTWAHVIARNEILRFRQGARRHVQGRVRISELAEVIAAVTADSRSRQHSARERAVSRLRDELPEHDRALLVLRIDRELSWDEVALAFADDPEHCSDDERRRLSQRLRKQFQKVKERLADRARAEGLLPE